MRHPTRRLLGQLVSAVAIVLTLVEAAAAQEPPSSSGGAETRWTAGIVSQHGVFGDDSPRSTDNVGIVLGAQVRRRTTGFTGISFEAILQPVGIQNPHFDETLHTVLFLVGPEMGRRTYVRLAFGPAFQFWTGSRAETALNFALATGIAIGRRVSAGSRWINPELVVRCSASPGAGSVLIGAQLAIGRR